jgi:predicted metal-binding protein
MNNLEHIGFIISLNEHTIIICNSCHQKEKNSPQKLPVGSKLFMENIKPYKQRCHMCNETIVLSQTDSWCELYPASTDLNSMTVAV